MNHKPMTAAIACLGLLVLVWPMCSGADEVGLENTFLRVVLVPESGALIVTDKRSGFEWKQINHPDEQATLMPASIQRDGVRIVADVAIPGTLRNGELRRASFRMEVRLAENTPDVFVEFSPQDPAEWRDVRYPFAFLSSERDSFVLFPHAEGLLLPARSDMPDFMDPGGETVHAGYGPYCACMGHVHMPSGRGVLTTFDTPELARYDMGQVPVENAKALAPFVVWRANKFRFDRPRRLVFTFEDRGGYVALAKHYRRLYCEKGQFKSLRTKADANPEVDKLAGAPVFWVFASPEDTLAVARMLKDDGVPRALIEVGQGMHFYSYRKEPEMVRALEDTVKGIRDLGYVVSCYDQYRDCFEPDPERTPFDQMNTDGFPKACVKQEDGSLRPGWPPGFVLNAEEGLALAKKHIPAEIERLPYAARFMDCIGTCPLWECEDWTPDRPLDAYGGMTARNALLDYVASLWLAVGTEGSMDCFLSRLHWLETPMSLVKWTAQDLKLPGWLPAPLSPAYDVNITPRYRIPFFSLVHHDEVMITWRWEDGFVRLPQYWQDKNLWSVLYGNTPMFFLNRETFERNREKIAQTCRYVCDWSRKVAYAEMMGHRLLSQDRMLQETTFSTGDGVVVNFSNEPRTVPNGSTIRARSYLAFTFADSGTPRHYSEPPVPETVYE